MEIARRELLRNVILGGAALALPKGLQFLEPPKSEPKGYLFIFKREEMFGDNFMLRYSTRSSEEDGEGVIASDYREHNNFTSVRLTKLLPSRYVRFNPTATSLSSAKLDLQACENQLRRLGHKGEIYSTICQVLYEDRYGTIASTHRLWPCRKGIEV